MFKKLKVTENKTRS